MSSLEFDTAALTGPIGLVAKMVPSNGAIPGSATEELSVRRLVIRLIIQVLGFGVLAAIAVMILQMAFGGSGMNLATWIIALIIISPFVIAQIRSFRSRRRTLGEITYRLPRFAADNHMTYVAAEPAAQHPVVRFRDGGPLAIRDLLRSPARSGLEVGTYFYERSMGRSIVEHRSSYVALDLATVGPSMTMVTKLGDVWGPVSVHRNTQHLVSVDDDFDMHFRVYCDPVDDDAVRARLTFQVRHALRIVAAKCDIEVDGGRLYVIARKELPFTDPAFWRWVADLNRFATIFAQPGAVVAAETVSAWKSRAAEREAIFVPPKIARANTSRSQ
ncbi:hypothetical protein [Microbacterium sp. SSM24]|uniref:hypothetical protein n=1 Tax=Microbacterium sp. SSM24 TaxID=2991714 RepID=UPI002228034A|nr:hypothetical protein [Microbacterium sp. SSM24]MCW3494646.1 hypothetical protein [Microbacterium sp. SSM24]